MTTHTEARRELARRLAPAWAELPGVAAVVISGSTARGTADGWSDLELGVYWHDTPTDEDRDCAIRTLRAVPTRRVGMVLDIGWFGVDNVLVDGFQVDVAMNTCDGIERLLRQVLDERDLTDDKHDLVGMLAEVEPLSGTERVRDWQGRMVIDDALRKALVERNLRFTPASALELDLRRGNDVRAVERTLEWVQKGLRALFALNGAWFVGFKAARARLPTLPIQPADTEQRLAEALAGPASAGGVVGWIDELFALAGPVADVQAASDRFHAPGRTPWSPEAIAEVATTSP